MHREFVFGGEVKFVEGYFGKSGLLEKGQVTWGGGYFGSYNRHMGIASRAYFGK